jgi:hypothetical protein
MFKNARFRVKGRQEELCGKKRERNDSTASRPSGEGLCRLPQRDRFMQSQASTSVLNQNTSVFGNSQVNYGELGGFIEETGPLGKIHLVFKS